MEAYRNACNGYNQQFFVFKNQDLVKSGFFGMFAQVPGADGEAMDASETQAHATAAARASADGMLKSAFSMPIKIDPEEEKRLLTLRKKIHQSEFKREQLETEYLSLRAHYVHESQLVRKTRAYEMGRWKLLKELMERRGKVLALMRVKVAMGRDIEALIRHRGTMLENRTTDANGEERSKLGGGRDLVDVWNNIDAQLKEAELACLELDTPPELSKMALTPDVSISSSSNAVHNYSTRSPRKNGSDEDDKNGKRRKRSSSITSAEEAETTNHHYTVKKSTIPKGLEAHVIPWDCMVEPSTPYDVPLLLSCLSSATDKAVGYCKYEEGQYT